MFDFFPFDRGSAMNVMGAMKVMYFIDREGAMKASCILLAYGYLNHYFCFFLGQEKEGDLLQGGLILYHCSYYTKLKYSLA